jgi:autocrine motility factor receptor
MFLDLGWFYVCMSVFWGAGPSTLLLLTFECFTLFVDCVQTLIKYIIHLIDLRFRGQWEARGKYLYITEFFTESLIMVATLGHYIQILVLHGLAFTLIDLLIFLHIRIVYSNLREKIRAYRNYRLLAQNMDAWFVPVPRNELEHFNDTCAICRERMDNARRLPCGHIFHLYFFFYTYTHTHTHRHRHNSLFSFILLFSNTLALVCVLGWNIIILVLLVVVLCYKQHKLQLQGLEMLKVIGM